MANVSLGLTQSGLEKVTEDTNINALAKAYGVTVDALIDANPQWMQNGRVNGNILSAGSVVNYPSTGTAATTPTGTTGGSGDVAVLGGPAGLLPNTTAANATPAFEVFAAYAQLAGIEDMRMLRDIYAAAGDYFADGIPSGDILDLMAVSGTAPKSFQKYLEDFTAIRTGTTGITTIAEWNQAKSQYKNLLAQYGLRDIATDEYANQFLRNDVSVSEAAARMDIAYNAVINADEALKAQLKTYYPSLSNADIVKSILGVGKTVDQLQREIGIAGIQAEAATAGITGVLSAAELEKQGVDRMKAREGYQTVAAATPGYEAAAARARQSPADIQKELEKEQLLGLRSQRRAELAIREQGLIAGQSGTGQTSLGKSAAGSF